MVRSVFDATFQKILNVNYFAKSESASSNYQFGNFLSVLKSLALNLLFVGLYKLSENQKFEKKVSFKTR